MLFIEPHFKAFFLWGGGAAFLVLSCYNTSGYAEAWRNSRATVTLYIPPVYPTLLAAKEA